MSILHIHPDDNVAIAIEPLTAGQVITLNGRQINCIQDIPQGHKFACTAIQQDDNIIKYGHSIGHATTTIKIGEWVHSHNLATNLQDKIEYQYTPTKPSGVAMPQQPNFMGYRRSNGRVGTRNEIWILNTVGCVNTTAQRIAEIARNRYPNEVDGIHAFSHPFGCSQLGDDLGKTRSILASLASNSNAGGVLILGLGCENNQLQVLIDQIKKSADPKRIRYFNSQNVDNEIEAGLTAIDELIHIVKHDQRQTVPLSDLVIGLKCGGSDAFSGLTANPLLGQITDRLTAAGGTAILGEVPEMFGAEQQLMNRCIDETMFNKTVALINNFKQYFTEYKQPVYENPSPGNKQGGITTLEEKSLGAVQKGGQATITQILDYGEISTNKGLNLLQCPGNDAVSSTALIASGATLLLFTTGRGTPLGFPVPTIKVATNNKLAQQKAHWIDFNAGSLLDENKNLSQLSDELLKFIIAIVSGKQTQNEINGYREIAIWKQGVML